MDNKQRLYIYDRKEMVVLVLLGFMVAIFAFTLGVHLGKRVGVKPMIADNNNVSPAETVADKVPNKFELMEQGKGSGAAADTALGKALKEEVARTGVHLDVPRQIELPRDTHADNGGATTGAEVPSKEKGKKATKTAKAADTSSSGASEIVMNGKGSGEKAADTNAADASEGSTLAKPDPQKELANEELSPSGKTSAAKGRFALQVGSHPTLDEAREQIASLKALGMTPTLKAVTLAEKGKWYRIYVGNYPTREEAERAGNRFQSKNVIESFVVSKENE